ncbi:glycosyl transferase, family I [Desulfosarcina variabilis str. Montpellier]|uniref:glycosyltransferase family 4 protein n=1 Tax=Desulfosarcina variabilis TaxID=2300 RepID=UPI003AFA2575
MKIAPKRVMHFIESGGIYGAENVLLNLSREMIKEEENIPIIGCIVSDKAENSELYRKAREYGIAANKLLLRNFLLWYDLPSVAKKLKKERIGLIHSHGYKPSVFGYLISLITGIPIMATCHLWFLQDKIPLKMRFMIRLELFIYRYFPLVVAVSEPIKEILLDNGIPAHKVHVINNGIVLSDYNELTKDDSERLRRELEIEDVDLCFLNVGRLCRQKAQWNIILAAAHLNSHINGKRLRFFIVGEGILRSELQHQIEIHNLHDRVHLLGFREDVQKLMQIAHVFLLPSLDEGLPMALLEAMASMLPVITTPVGNIPNLIRQNYNGILIRVDNLEDLAGGIQMMAESESLRRRLAKQAIETIQTSYDSKKMLNDYNILYRKIIV